MKGRNSAQALGQHISTAPSLTHLNFAMNRKHRQIGVFAVCPLKAIVKETIDTRKLWKAKEAGIAFEVMRDATAGLLATFTFNPDDKVRVALVSRAGRICWDENF